MRAIVEQAIEPLIPAPPDNHPLGGHRHRTPSDATEPPLDRRTEPVSCPADAVHAEPFVKPRSWHDLLGAVRANLTPRRSGAGELAHKSRPACFFDEARARRAPPHGARAHELFAHMTWGITIKSIARIPGITLLPHTRDTTAILREHLRPADPGRRGRPVLRRVRHPRGGRPQAVGSSRRCQGPQWTSAHRSSGVLSRYAREASPSARLHALAGPVTMRIAD